MIKYMDYEAEDERLAPFDLKVCRTCNNKARKWATFCVICNTQFNQEEQDKNDE